MKDIADSGSSTATNQLEAQQTINLLLDRLANETTLRLEAEDRAERFSQHIIAIRESWSWRIMGPLRAIRRSLQ